METFRDRVAVVTGAGSGIGEAMARRFAREGMKLVLADIDEAAAGRVSAALVEDGARAIALRTDVANPKQVEALAERAFAAFGSVALLCNNAGVVPSGRFRPVWEFPLEDWAWSFDVNLMGVVHGIRSFVPRMLEAGGEGHVVTTASIAGLVSGSGSVVYSAAKHAAVRVTEALYASLKERGAPIGVSIFLPGLVRTRIYESERSRPAALQPETGPAEETEELKAVAEELYGNALAPEAAAEMVLDAVRANRLYQFSTDAYDAVIRDRTAALLERRNPDFASLLSLVTRDAQRPA